LSAFRWTPARMSELERAVERRCRVVLSRRGSEYVVVAHQLKTFGREEVLVGRVPITGELMEFELAALESFDVLDA
jgi:hypothetical protein